MRVASPASSAVQLRLAGTLRVECGGQERPLAPQDAALLAWLALEGATPRARLAQLLWPDKAPDAARNSLRQRLFQLRKSLGVELIAGSATLSLAAGIAHDLDDADTLLGPAAGEDLAPGEFAQWLQAQRSRRRDRVRASFAALADAAEAAKDWDDALNHAGELLALEPLSEQAHRRVMRLHYLRGDRAAALLAFDACERVLKDEVGATPSPETLQLLATIESSAAWTVEAATVLPPASVLRPPRMIGRDAERQRLEAAWNAGHVAAVIGEAGLGKTRLLQEFAAGRPQSVMAAGRPGDAGVPFATLARLLRGVVAGGAAASLPAATRGEIARVIPEFDGGMSRPVGEGQRLVLLRAVQSVLGTHAAHRSMILDDLHFADEASLDLLAGLIDGDDLVPQVPTTRWVLAWRPAEAGSPLQVLHDRLVEQVRLVPVVLRPLDVDALTDLVDSLGLPGVRGALLAPALLQRTGGNPLFLLETLKQAWVERSLDRLADAQRLPRPLSVGRLIERRIAQLSPSALALARVAGIAGVDFSVELAETVLQAGAMQFADAMNELERAQVLRGTAFAHDLVHDAVRDSVPRPIAELTHARVAAWLEPRHGEPARIARHWIDAGREEQALPWLEHAAERAGMAVRRREQIEFLDQKSRIEERLGRRPAAFESTMRAAEIEVTLADAASGSDTTRCDRLDALADGATARVRAATQRSNLAVMRGFHDEAERVAGAALREALREGVDEATLARCRIALGTASSSLDRSTEALVHFEAALGWVGVHADASMRCEFHGNLATTYDRLGRLDDGAAHHRTALRIAQQIDDYTNAAICSSNMASNRLRAGRPAEADALLEQAKRIYAQASDPSSILGFIAIEHGIVHRQLGRYASALREIDHGLDNLRRYAPGYVAILQAHQATCWAHLGQWARLDRSLDELQSIAVPSRTAVRLALLRREADIALHRRADRPALEQSLATIDAGTTPDYRHALQMELAALGEPTEALRALEAVAEEAAAIGHDMTRLPALARAATAALTLGERERALRHARTAWSLAERLCCVAFYALDPWLHCARVFEALGDRDAASEVSQRAGRWIDQALRSAEVAPEFSDSFLHRNPVNRELLAIAARLNGTG